MPLFNIGMRSNIANDDYNADTNLNSRSLYRQVYIYFNNLFNTPINTIPYYQLTVDGKCLHKYVAIT